MRRLGHGGHRRRDLEVLVLGEAVEIQLHHLGAAGLGLDLHQPVSVGWPY
jgi:hypothetical protein